MGDGGLYWHRLVDWTAVTAHWIATHPHLHNTTIITMYTSTSTTTTTIITITIATITTITITTITYRARVVSEVSLLTALGGGGEECEASGSLSSSRGSVSSLFEPVSR